MVFTGIQLQRSEGLKKDEGSSGGRSGSLGELQGLCTCYSACPEALPRALASHGPRCSPEGLPSPSGSGYLPSGAFFFPAFTHS